MTENLELYMRPGYQEVARRTDHGFPARVLLQAIATAMT